MATPIPLRWTAVCFVLATVCSPTLALAGGSRNGIVEPDGDATGVGALTGTAEGLGRNGIGPSAIGAAALETLESPPSLRRRVKKEKAVEAKDGGGAGSGAGANARKGDRGETKVSNRSKKKGDTGTSSVVGEEEIGPTSSTALESSATTFNRTGDATYAHAHVWMPKPFPCEPSEPDASAPVRGVYYVKVPKTNSSHWRDVFLRSSRHRSAALTETRECYTDASHMDVATEARLRHRDRDRSLLTTFVRDVRDWKAANYYHKLAKNNESLPSARGMASFVMRKRNGQAGYIRTLDSFDAYGAGASPTEVARAIMAEYDFIGVVDDPDRSLVCMRMLFGLEPRDILYNPSHLAGSISFRTGDKGVCLPILPNYVYPEADGVMSGEIWMAENAIDLALYNETQRSLEATIDFLGRDEFERALQEHRELMGRVREKCLPTVRYRCSETGAFQKEDDCGVGGCGHHCINDVVFGAQSG